MEWKEVRLGDVYEVHNGLSKSGKYFGYGHPFLTFSDVFKNFFLPQVFGNKVDSTEKERNSYNIKRGDVFITRTSETAEELGMSSVALKDVPYATYNGFTKRLRPIDGETLVLPEFIGYHLRSKRFRNNFYVLSGGMSTRASLANGDLLNMKVQLPSIEDQRRIASILSSLDRKIELNNKINAQLEEMAQAIFKSWFIEPKDYTLAKLEDVTVKVTDGVHNTVENVEGSPYLLLSCKNIVGGKLSISDKERTIGKETFETLRKRTKLERLDILISTVGTVGEVVLLNESPDFIEFQRSVGIIKTDREKASPYYVFLALKEKQKELKNTAHGAVQQCIFISDLKEFQIPLSEKSRIDNFDAVVEPIFTKIHILQKENLHLSQLRDTLLPKLMNGEIELPDDDYLQHCLYFKGEEECPFPNGTHAAWYWRDEAMGQDENHRRIGHSFIEKGLQFIPLPAEQVQQLPSDIQDMLAYATACACNMQPMGGDEYLKHYGKSIEELNEIDKK